MAEKYTVVFPKFLVKTPDIEQKIFRGIATVSIHDCSNEQEIAKVVEDADAVIVWGPIVITGNVIASMKRCKIIQAIGIGFDNVDIKAAGRKGIYVCNVPDFCIDEVADHTIGLLLMLNRKLYHLVSVGKKGLWYSQVPSEISTPVMRLSGKTLGLIGVGSIGTAVALRAKSLGLRIVFYDPYVAPGIEKSLGFERAESLDALFEKADIVSIHVPLTDETHHIISETNLRKMKKTAFLINTARGKLVDSTALLKALKEGLIAGAALDVMENEPPDPNDPLLSLDNLLITPHRAFYSEEARAENRTKASLNVSRVLQGKEPFYVVNKNSLKK